MAVNKVVVNGDENNPVLDLTGDSVHAAALYSGMTAHDASGNTIVGTFTLEKAWQAELGKDISDVQHASDIAALEAEIANTYLTKSSASSLYYTKTDSDNRYYTKTAADGKYLTIETAASTYLTQADAASTYYTKSQTDSKYLLQTTAASDYATKTSLNSYYTKTETENTFLSKTDASSTYLSQTSASSTYLSKTDASSTYLPLSGGTITNTLIVSKLSTDTNAVVRRGDLVAGTGLSLSGTTYSIAQATTSALGGLKVGYAGKPTTPLRKQKSNRDFAVEVNSNGVGFVNVPYPTVNIKQDTAGSSSFQYSISHDGAITDNGEASSPTYTSITINNVSNAAHASSADKIKNIADNYSWQISVTSSVPSSKSSRTLYFIT